MHLAAASITDPISLRGASFSVRTRCLQAPSRWRTIPIAMAPGVFDDDFLLETETARVLYHEHAEEPADHRLPLPPAARSDRREPSLPFDHRASGSTVTTTSGARCARTACRKSTAPATRSDWEKFEAWARTVPYTLRNPLYHWTHLELKCPFGIDDRLLDPDAARGDLRAAATSCSPTTTSRRRGCSSSIACIVVCTTDDPVDRLEHHAGARGVSRRARRPAATRRGGPTRRWPWTIRRRSAAGLERLEAASGVSIGTYAQLLDALEKRHAFFHELGCRLSDHGLERCTPTTTRCPRCAPRSRRRVAAGRYGRPRSATSPALLHDLALLDHSRGWVQQFHLGALRNNNTRMLDEARPRHRLRLDRRLRRWRARSRASSIASTRATSSPRTILYNLNPRDNELLRHDDRQLPGRLASPARCSTAAPGGSSISSTAWRSR